MKKTLLFISLFAPFSAFAHQDALFASQILHELAHGHILHGLVYALTRFESLSLLCLLFGLCRYRFKPKCRSIFTDCNN